MKALVNAFFPESHPLVNPEPVLLVNDDQGQFVQPGAGGFKAGAITVLMAETLNSWCRSRVKCFVET